MTEQITTSQVSILQQGFHSIMREGVRSFTVESLARQLGISKKTIYKFYPTKEILLQKIFEFIIGQIHAMFQEIRESEPNPALQFIKVMEFIAQKISQISMQKMADLKLRYPRVWREIEQFRLNRVNDFYQILKLGQEKGYVRPELDVRTVATIYIQIINSTIQPEFFLEHDLPIGRTIRRFMDVVVRGLFTQKGINVLKAYYDRKN
ncbi:MAG: TetR/AcrR family transcriptional regulator [Fidelibacterota bacterium]